MKKGKKKKDENECSTSKCFFEDTELLSKGKNASLFTLQIKKKEKKKNKIMKEREKISLFNKSFDIISNPELK